MMKFSLAFVLLFTIVFSVQGSELPGDLPTYSAKFQTLINELGEQNSDSSRNEYKEEINKMMDKLKIFQSPNIGNTQNFTLEWFSGSYSQGVPMRIILVVSSYEGMYLNSGIGTFYAALADFLLNHGHSVTVLYTRTDRSDIGVNNFLKWQQASIKKGITVVKLDPSPILVTSPLHTQVSYRVYRYLKEHQKDFDVAHFPEWEGPGYFSVVAKHQGLAFTNKLLIVGLHGPWRWVKHGNQDPTLTEEEEVEVDWLERRSVELADLVLTPSVDLPRWLATQGWALPNVSQIHLMPFLPGKEVHMINQRPQPTETSMKVKEFVFFGRLEARKGLLLFADALDLLASSKPARKIKVTFMGRSVDIDGQAATLYLDERAKKGGWPFKVIYITHKDRKGGLDYLLEKGKGRLAVIPSLVDNAPYTIYECLYTHIPFIASNLPSIANLVQEDDRATVLFTPQAGDIAIKMRSLLEEGVSTARGLLTAEGATKSWESFYNMVSVQLKQLITSSVGFVQIPKEATAVVLPKVSVCITYFNRPQFLPIAIQSIKEQDYPLDRIEIVLVDDGSTNQDAIDYITSLEDEFEANDWQIIRTENNYLGAARNTAARSARGEYIFFLDDDNLIAPNSISMYVSVAMTTKADVLTGAHDVFKGNGLPPTLESDPNSLSRSIPLGPAIYVGVFRNCFGDANFFINRAAFIRTGGFTEEKGVGQEDYEFLSKAVLSNLKLEAVPEVMLHYRMHNRTDQMMFNTDPVQNAARVIRTWAEAMDDEGDSSDLLKIHAVKRVRTLERISRSELGCNMTVLSVSPSSFPVITEVVLNFTAITMDCVLSEVFIGSFPCKDLRVLNGSFSCVSPAIPFPNIYSVSVEYADNTEIFNTDATVGVTQATVYMTIAVMVIQYEADPSVFTLTLLFDVFSDLLNIPSSAFVLIDDIITQLASAKRSAALETHSTRFSIVSTNPSISASDEANNLILAAQADPAAFTGVGVTVNNFNLVASCDNINPQIQTNCACAANFYGDACDQKPDCPNNCTQNGDCVDGPFSRVCNCYAGFTGRDCSAPTCTDDCSGHGSCRLLSGAAPECICDAGWLGDSCSTAQTCPNSCSGFGSCVSGACVCVEGRGGDDCSEPSTYLVASSHSNASSEDAVTIGLGVAVSVVGVLIIVAVILGIYVIRLRRRP